MIYDFENKNVTNSIKTGNIFQIDKTSDLYLKVAFAYASNRWNGAIPLRSKYQGVNIPLTKDDVYEWAKQCYRDLDPSCEDVWQEAQRRYWDSSNAHDTKLVFSALNSPVGSPTQWHCRKHGPVQQCNPQPASRIRDLKKRGYFVATEKRDCPTCGGKQYFDLLIRLPRHASECDKREHIPVALRNKIKRTLPMKDACFDASIQESEAVVDHKFPSTRWVRGETVNSVDMTEEEIRHKFQILTNQTNLQKERYCQRCLESGIRGDFFGISWFYAGDEKWRGASKADENGCIGCCWYDLAVWKKKFNEFLGSRPENGTM